MSGLVEGTIIIVISYCWKWIWHTAAAGPPYDNRRKLL